LASAVALKRYDGAQVLRCALIADLKGNFSSVIEEQLGLDVWGAHADGTVDIMVETPTERADVETFFAQSKCVVAVENVQDQLDAVEKDLAQANATAADWFDVYHNLPETLVWWKELAAAHVDLGCVYKENIYNVPTTKGRYLSAFECRLGGVTTRPILYNQCQIHAREWVSGTTCQYIVHTLLNRYKAGNAVAKDILNAFNIAFVVVTNPDGYVNSWDSDRMWRKNMRNNAQCATRPACCGVDLNRNFNDGQWGGGGSSADPCAETYRGPSAASEPETQAVSSYFNSLQSQASVYSSIDWHSYSQLVLRPWGYTNTPPPNDARMISMGADYVAAVKAYDGKTYTSQKSIDLYVTTGTASDYYFTQKASNGKTAASRPASWTVELRPTTSNPGFILPAAQIKPTGQENYDGMVTMVVNLMKNGPLPL
jgi:murein tripeptide amidase MpaA